MYLLVVIKESNVWFREISDVFSVGMGIIGFLLLLFRSIMS